MGNAWKVGKRRKEERQPEERSARGEGVRSFAAGLLLARALPCAVIRGGWLMTAATGGNAGGVFAAAVFAAACALYTMLWEERKEQGGRRRLAAAAVLYALSNSLQCAALLHRGAMAGALVSLLDCVVIGWALWCDRGKKGAHIAISAAMCITAVMVAEWLGIPCDGKVAALLIELSGAAAAGRALVLTKEGHKPEWTVAGVAAAMAWEAVLG